MELNTIRRSGRKLWLIFTDELESAKICSKSGLLAVDGVCNSSSSNASVYTEYFAPGTAPTSYCDRHYALRICTESGKSATKYCPGDLVVQRVYLHIDGTIEFAKL